MSVQFDPSGQLDISTDPSDLPEVGDGPDIASGALTRCKNLRINQKGQAKTRDGSAKLNATAINTAIWWIEEQGGERYTFAGTAIYKDETSIETGLTSAQWSAMKYNSFNDTTESVFALNGTDRKRIEGSTVREWGIAAPTEAPTLTAGTSGTGLTGQYNAKYTYVRKSGSTVIEESNPSPPADAYLTLSGQALLVAVTAPTDPQVTHIRLYRTDANGLIYYRDQDIAVGLYSHGVTFSWEDTDDYISGNSFKFTYTDSTHSTENTQTWEQTASEAENNSAEGYPSGAWYEEDDPLYQQYLFYLQQQQQGYPGTGAPT